jgi:hypothetical protein
MLDLAAAASGLIIAWGGVCRAVTMDGNTTSWVRWAISTHAAAGLALALAAYALPDAVAVCLVAVAVTSAVLMVVTARAWRAGVPVSYQADPAAAVAERDLAGAVLYGRRESDRMPLGPPEVAPATWSRRHDVD